MTSGRRAGRGEERSTTGPVARGSSSSCGSGDGLRAAKKMRKILLDTTGTVTVGMPAVTDVVPAPGFEVDAILALSAAAERNSKDPLAAAIVEGAAERGLTPLAPTRFEAVTGQGIRAWLGERRILVGNQAFLEEAGINVDKLMAGAERLADEDKTPVFVALDQRAGGIIAIADPAKADAQAAIAALRKLELLVVMITSDDRRTADGIARRAGVDRVLAEVPPQDKAREVRKLQVEGRTVAMFGRFKAGPGPHLRADRTASCEESGEESPASEWVCY